MWKLRRDAYDIPPYHDVSFVRDEAAQEVMRVRARRRDRLVARAFVTMAVSFAGALVAGLARMMAGLAAGMVIFAAAFVFGAAQLLTYKPRLACTSCGKRLKTAWGPVGEKREGEYLVCVSCRRYVFTYRTSR